MDSEEAVTDDDTLLRDFERAMIPAEQWDREMLARLAYIHLRRYRLREAIERIQQGVVVLNAAHGVAEAPGAGYHQLVSATWLATAMAAMESDDPPLSWADFSTRYAHLLDLDATAPVQGRPPRLLPSRPSRFDRILMSG